MNAFFPELEPVRRQPAQRRSPAGTPKPRSSKPSISLVNPCVGCAWERNPFKVPPTIPQSPLLIVVGMGPGGVEEKELRPFIDPSGLIVRSALNEAGIAEDRVMFANVSRCCPEKGNYDDPRHEKAEKRCQRYLESELARLPNIPVLLLGTRPMQRFLGSKKQRIGSYRGLWIEAKEYSPGRPSFVARHPAQFLRIEDDDVRQAKQEEFYADVRRMADRILGREPQSRFKVTVYESPMAACERGFVKMMVQHPGPWAFDIEAYDGDAFPSRKAVSTDPCHPDFRLRGVAFAVDAETAYWIECMNFSVEQVRQCLAPIFTSDVEKWAFNGPYDEEGLVYPGFVPTVKNRSGDGMLAMIALGDGNHESLRLEKAVVDILGQSQYWNGIDKSRMRDIPLEECAANAGGDACYTYQLTALLHDRLAAGQYLTY